MTYQPPPGYPAAPSAAADPTDVMGRRIAAWSFDFLLFFVVALAVAVPWWFNAADRYNGVGTDFCNAVTHVGRFEGTYSERLLVDEGMNEATVDLVKDRNNDACFQVGDDAWVSENSTFAVAVGIALGIGIVLPLANYVFIQGATGASVGKRMLGLRVVKGDGQLVRFGSNLLRTFMFIVDMSPFCFPFSVLIGGITALASKGHRRVGDMAAGTFVVSAASVGAPITVLQPMPMAWPAAPPGGVYAPPGVQATPVTPVVPPVFPSGPPTTPPPAPTAMMSPPVLPVSPGPPPAGPVVEPDASTLPPSSVVPPVDSEPPNPDNAQWDDRWGAWMRKHPTTGHWQRWDDGTSTWLDV